ncbi:MAG TPA: hypothetical protein ACFYD7_04235 [Candidatus Wujingus californicus]|uniref:hypothetical protein n=2 Tax=Candidatus Wujingus californicus TaxID=3367618 RepID=UPI001D36051C|nr:hypothetical protein [Planctomycetota bacterium]MDO8094932.1 hypothetical protein [Candidatus Brocadiales bacterium]
MKSKMSGEDEMNKRLENIKSLIKVRPHDCNHDGYRNVPVIKGLPLKIVFKRICNNLYLRGHCTRQNFT